MVIQKSQQNAKIILQEKFVVVLCVCCGFFLVFCLDLVAFPCGVVVFCQLFCNYIVVLLFLCDVYILSTLLVHHGYHSKSTVKLKVVTTVKFRTKS